MNEIEALFTSLHGGDALRRRILRLIDEASALARSNSIDLHIMTFAFTDASIARALKSAASTCPSMHIRILADWSQRIRFRGQQVGSLAALNLPNIEVRYNYDQPYIWDAETGHMRWSYHASGGLLHHKTLGVLVNGRPWQLILGSFNWTAAAVRGYENLVVLNSEQDASLPILWRMELEFEALWTDGRRSLSPQEAHLHYQSVLEEFRHNPAASPAEIRGLEQGAGTHLKVLDAEFYPAQGSPDSGDAVIAFSCRGMEKTAGLGGCAEQNRSQRMILRSSLNRLRHVPLTMTNLALGTIARAVAGDTLKVAMYGMSARVPEYGALIDAARRGVRILLVLDRIAGTHVHSRLLSAAQKEGLAIELRTAGRTMHQKYLVHIESETVLTGTANLSTDASSRHYEHRIRIRSSKLAAQFSADFDEIWARLSASVEAAGRKEERSEPLSSNSELP